MTKILITGGAGFIGSNLAQHFIKRGYQVRIFDNLSRRGAEKNLQWLRNSFGEAFEFIKGDVRQSEALKTASVGIDVIYHLAAQVAVTTSVTSPREDFEINALGTFNVLEAARTSGNNPIVFYSSTNKVYGGMKEIAVRATSSRYEYLDMPLGVSESQPLDFYSPYGCSKGAGDQYTRDYSRIYGLRTIVFRQSCIYGERQFGVEDQGWLAHFAITAQKGSDVTIYGDGKQVRDILYISDLVNAIELATIRHIDITAGKVYNIGGGPSSVLSIWAETRSILESLAGHPIETKWGDWRPGDQRIYVSDIRSAQKDFGWMPRIAPHDGVKKMWDWITENSELFAS